MDYIQPNWPAPKNVRAYTTLRTANITRAECSDQVKSLFSLPSEPIWLDQKHTAIVLKADKEVRHSIADATFSKEKNIVCAVLTADCLPVLLCDAEGKYVAAIHAGWRGLAQNIIEASITTYSSSPSHLMAWLGPAIGPQKFEVGRDVYDAFVQQNIDYALAFTRLPQKEKWLANLYQIAKIKLKRLGITQIYGGGFCTYTQAALFFSYRREPTNPGRLLSLIWLDE